MISHNFKLINIIFRHMTFDLNILTLVHTMINYSAD